MTDIRSHRFTRFLERVGEAAGVELRPGTEAGFLIRDLLAEFVDGDEPEDVREARAKGRRDGLKAGLKEGAANAVESDAALREVAQRIAHNAVYEATDHMRAAVERELIAARAQEGRTPRVTVSALWREEDGRQVGHCPCCGLQVGAVRHLRRATRYNGPQFSGVTYGGVEDGKREVERMAFERAQRVRRQGGEA